MNHTSTDWKTMQMGSEGWAVFAGPRMIASNLTEEHARLIASAPELDAKNKILLDALITIQEVLHGPGNINVHWLKPHVDEAIAKANDCAI